MAYELPQETIDNLVLDANSFATFIIGLITDTVVTRTGAIYPTLPKLIQGIMEAGGFEPFATEAELLANVPTVPKTAAKAMDTKAIWYWDGTWHDTGLSELAQANNYTNNRYNVIVDQIMKLKLKQADDSPIIPLLADAAGRALAYYDKTKDRFVAGGLIQSIMELLPNLRKYDDPRYLAVLVDANGRLLLGWDMVLDQPVGFGGGALTTAATKQYKYYPQKPLSKEVNHIISYGQSLSVGATATAILSTTQPYFNTTFGFTVVENNVEKTYASPRMDVAATSIQPLSESFYSPSSDNYPNRGESHCSGMANYASRAMMMESNVNPQNHVIMASTAGHGGYTIDQLSKGASWYSVFINHVNKGKELNVGKTYHVPAVPWIQGENNAVSGGIQTPYATYKAKLVQLHSDIDTDVKAITGQTDTIKFITYQMSYAARTWPDIAKAQLDLARDNDNFILSTPMYHFPYAGDNIHLTNVGYKWLGAYIGRAYKQYMIEGRKPDFLNPLSAVIKGNTIVIKFDVPKAPLVVDTTTLASTTQKGFKVLSGATDVAVTDVSAAGDTVVLSLATAPTDNVTVRYALDYLGSGLNITGGASGNVRDSTPDTAVINNVTKPLYHLCPHFEMTAFYDKGI